MAAEIFIPIDRKKMILLTLFYGVIGITVFLILYYWGENQDWLNPLVFKVASVVILFFFIVVAGTFGKNVRRKTAGLTINHHGVLDETSSIALGLLKWKDITGISTAKTPTTKYLLIQVKKPQQYIDNAKNGAVKRLLNQNMVWYKTPVVINVSALDIKLEELEGMLGEYVGKRSKK